MSSRAKLTVSQTLCPLFFDSASSDLCTERERTHFFFCFRSSSFFFACVRFIFDFFISISQAVDPTEDSVSVLDPSDMKNGKQKMLIQIAGRRVIRSRQVRNTFSFLKPSLSFFSSLFCYHSMNYFLILLCHVGGVVCPVLE